MNTEEIPKAPRTPSPVAEKLLFQSRGTRGIWFWVAIFWAIVGWQIPYVFARGLPEDLLLLISSTEVTGQVLKVQDTAGLPVNRVQPQEILYSYQYDGQSYEGASSTLDKELLKALGPEVIVEVSAWAPSISRAQGTQRATYGILGAFTIAFPIFGLLLAWAVVGRSRRDRAAFIHGAAALAKKLDGKSNGSSATLRWELSVDGRLYFGELTTRAHPAFVALCQQEEIPVLYDPADPRDSIVYLA